MVCGITREAVGALDDDALFAVYPSLVARIEAVYEGCAGLPGGPVEPTAITIERGGATTAASARPGAVFGALGGGGEGPLPATLPWTVFAPHAALAADVICEAMPRYVLPGGSYNVMLSLRPAAVAPAASLGGESSWSRSRAAQLQLASVASSVTVSASVLGMPITAAVGSGSRGIMRLLATVTCTPGSVSVAVEVRSWLPMHPSPLPPTSFTPLPAHPQIPDDAPFGSVLAVQRISVCGGLVAGLPLRVPVGGMMAPLDVAGAAAGPFQTPCISYDGAASCMT